MSEARNDPYSALRVPAFRFYASAWTFAVLGQQIQSVAIGWSLYARTKDPLVLGWVGLLQAIPVMTLAIPAGQLADKFDRRKVLLLSQVASVLTSIGLVACSMNDAGIGAFYLLLFLDAIANAIGWPARSSILPLLVPVETISNAVTWNSSLFHSASVIGPALGGLIVLKSVTAALACDLIAGAWYVLCLSLIHLRPQEKSKEPVSLSSLLAGLRFVVQQKIILATISLDLFAVLLGGAVYLLPAVATDILKVDARGFGLLRAAPAIGAITMGMTLAHMPPLKKAGKAMLLAVAGFGVATIVFGLSRNFYLSLIALFLTGAVDNISVVVRHTLVQVLTPDAMRGRVSAVNNVFIGASNELGGFESGLTARLLGITTSIVGGGIGTVLVVIGIDRVFPQVRALGPLNEVRLTEEQTAEVANEGASPPK